MRFPGGGSCVSNKLLPDLGAASHCRVAFRQGHWTRSPHPHVPTPSPLEKETSQGGHTAGLSRGQVRTPGLRPPRCARPGGQARPPGHSTILWPAGVEAGKDSGFLPPLPRPQDKHSGSLSPHRRQPDANPAPQGPGHGHGQLASEPSPGVLEGPRVKAPTASACSGYSGQEEASLDHPAERRQQALSNANCLTAPRPCRLLRPLPSPRTPDGSEASPCPSVVRHGDSAVCEPDPLTGQTHAEPPAPRLPCPAGQPASASP